MKRNDQILKCNDKWHYKSFNRIKSNSEKKH